MKILRSNLLIDTGPTINQLGAELIETPDMYKRINNTGTIVEVGLKCKMFCDKDKGKNVIVENFKFESDRLNPRTCKGLGLKPHWHFLVHESRVQLLLEK